MYMRTALLAAFLPSCEATREYRRMVLRSASALEPATEPPHFLESGVTLDTSRKLAVYYDMGLGDKELELVRRAVAIGVPVEMRSLRLYGFRYEAARRAALGAILQITKDPSTCRLAEQTELLATTREALTAASSALLSDDMSAERRAQIAETCQLLADRIAPELTPAESTALANNIARRIS